MTDVTVLLPPPEDETFIIDGGDETIVEPGDDSTALIATLEAGPPGAAGTTDHGALQGLGDDDHPQYLNNTRGDARYWPLSTDLATQAELDAETSARQAADTSEQAARVSADALLIPLTQKGAASGVATLDGTATVPDAQIPATITRDSELAAAIAALVNSAPVTLDTLAEIAAALGNDPNLATTLTTLIGTKADKSEPFVTTAATAGLSGETPIGSIILPPGLLAARPSAASVAAGALYFATDVLIVYRSTGAAWVTVLDAVNRPTGGQLPGKDTRLAALNTALDAATSGQGVDILILGDSIISNSPASPDLKIYKMLQQLYGGRNGVATAVQNGYLNAQDDMTGNGTTNANGLKFRAVDFTNGQHREFTKNCDGVIVVWGAGTGSIRVRDGGAAGSIITTIDTSLGTSSGNFTSVDLTTTASHNVYFESVGNTRLEGALPTRGNRTTGVRVWSIALGGDFTKYYSQVDGLRITNFLAKLAAAGRDVHVISNLGYNDPDSELQTETDELYDIIRAAYPNCSILSVAPYYNHSSVGGLYQSDVIRGIAEDHDAAFIDIGRALGTVDQDVWDFSRDGVHPDEIGGNIIASLIMGAITGNVAGMAIAMAIVNQNSNFNTWSANTFTSDNGTNGKLVIGQAFGGQYLQIWDDDTETSAVLGLFDETLLDVLGLAAAGGGIGFGVGGATALAEFFYLNGANELKVTANILTTETASTGGHLMSRDAADARYPRTAALAASFDMNAQKLTNLADATAATDALNRQTADARYHLPNFVRKTGNEIVNSSVVLQNDDHLLAALVVSATYEFEALILFDGATAGDIQIAFTVPTGATLNWQGIGPVVGAAANTANLMGPTVVASGTAAPPYGAIGAGTTQAIRVVGIVRTDASHSGNLQLQWAQGSSSGTDTRVLTDSFLITRKVA